MVKILMNRIRWTIKKLILVTAFTAGAVVVIMNFIFIAGIIFRLADAPLLFVDTISTYLLVTMTFLGAAYTLQEGGHIKVELLTSNLPPKARNWLQRITSCIGFGAVLWFAWMVWRLVHNTYSTGVRDTSVFRFSLFPPRLMMLIGIGVLALAIAIQIFDNDRPAPK